MNQLNQNLKMIQLSKNNLQKLIKNTDNVHKARELREYYERLSVEEKIILKIIGE